MCFVVACKQCGKSGWGGCGRHLPSVYAGIEKGNHCMCRPWPGVAAATNSNQPPTGEQVKGASSGTTATVLVTTLALLLIAYFTM